MQYLFEKYFNFLFPKKRSPAPRKTGRRSLKNYHSVA